MSTTQQLALPGVVAESAIEWVWAEEAEGESDVTFVHETVMKHEVVEALAPEDGAIYVDVTLGGGGHTEAILLAAPGARVIAFDRDETAVRAASERLVMFGDRLQIVRSSFSHLVEKLAELGVTSIRGLCADLGVSSPQLDDPARGMSFRREGPIDMRMDPSEGDTALDLIDQLDDDELANVIFRYGDERRSRRIARSLKRALSDGELVTTLDLRRAIVRAVGPVRVGGVDPATRTFQALRIAVNRELDELESLLNALPSLIDPGGVAAVLSFHSLEDRLVKQAFHERSTWQPLSKKPLGATEDECSMNVRSRSAKLRAARAPVDAARPRRGMTAKRATKFLALWTLATIAAVSAFLVHLALRGKTVSLGYELGRARAEQARLREVKRVLEVEAASYKTPERVEIVARTLLGMEPPAADRVLSIGATAAAPDRVLAESDSRAGSAESP